MEDMVKLAHQKLHQREVPGSEYTGWLDLPQRVEQDEFKRIRETINRLSQKAEVLIVIGIGGSYLGAKSAIELLGHTYRNQMGQGMEVYFAGTNISSTYLADLLELVKDKEIAVNVISKSGTTLEPAIAFRVFRRMLEERYGEEGARGRIVATTDASKGALKQLAEEKGYETYVVPDDVGGRYSVLTPVGLLPIAAAGIDIEEVIDGAKAGIDLFSREALADNDCYCYAALRNILYNKGKSVELLTSYEPALSYFAEWWKQLFGESEGKEHKGLFPASANFSTDLHSLGQYIQDGRRNLFVTTMWAEEARRKVLVPDIADGDDGLDYLVDKELHYINEMACKGTIMAHSQGGVPNLKIEIPKLTPFYYGQLVYFFEKACAISGYLLGVNPYDQPGVEAYKKNMFNLLGKPE